MKFLHTSDWHLGRSLYGKKRYKEFSEFLDWLAQTIETEKVDVLLVAGDIFDTCTPGNRAQELYYRFLFQVSKSCCRHIVVIAGNHDSPTFLDAPKELLRALNVYVIGSVTEKPEDEVIVLYENKQPQAIVCAVPYLRDKDIRTVEPGETIDDKNNKLVEGLKKHYTDVCDIAEKKRLELGKSCSGDIPLVAMGHLFTAGGKTVDGDGVRDLYVGTLAHVDQDVFPPSIDYLALGHLHVSQIVADKEHIRYSGSPLPMGFGEATQKKKVVLIEFEKLIPCIQDLTVPCFQSLVRIDGLWDEIQIKLEKLIQEESRAWLEIEYTGSEVIGDLSDRLDKLLEPSAMEIRRIKNRLVMDRVMNTVVKDETLDDLNPDDIFSRYLDSFKVPEGDREELMVSYHEIVHSLKEEDSNAE